MQKNLLWIVIILVVLGGAYFLLAKPAAAPSTDSTAGDEAMSGADNMMDGKVMEDGTVGDETMMGDEPFAALISYTDSGFEPKSVTIKKGETVRFVNNSSSEETWPASAVHPTHSVYPDKSSSDCLGSSFDACRGLKPGEFWEFTFTNVGEWRFHDHVHASKTGVVIVTE